MALTPVMVFHISAGTVGLLSRAAAMAVGKGSREHRLAGNVFVVSMLSLSVSGAYGVLAKPDVEWLDGRTDVLSGDHGVVDCPAQLFQRSRSDDVMYSPGMG